ncbi:Serine/threonine-protein phosphatase 2A activator 1 [Chaetomidium leptoderma]|uniref:Serine/threonine-protein phosphatase 2A activator n=1 Tax=Chaetomidium leptoderma TaxID=669021 RepID=A0AAN6VY83_9PEZI|nr:Serine/threonine-protein phosphatase 2A activator 1 [Chaetomidium leptoderma]
MDPPPPPTSQSSTPTAPPPSSTSNLPRLAVLPPSKTHPFHPPAKRINTGADVPHFLSSLAYHDIGVFILQLTRALCPRKLAALSSSSSGEIQTFPLDAPRSDPSPVTNLREMLHKVEAMIDEVPPQKGPRRFGNVSFRRWCEVLDERVEGLLKEYLPGVLWEGWGEGVMGEVKAYFLGGFGSAQRLDYGTGHELSFLAFLGCLWKLGVFEGEGEAQRGDGEVERSLVLGVFEPYLKVIRRLILTYNLEPAGSHGVWGLDDHAFLPYIFGSAQLTRPITDTEPMPLEGSVPGAPQPSDVAKPAAVDLYRDSNMYFSAIGFINDVKTGPFWEHSPILFDISGVKHGWGKINKGMIKMFNAEVLSKFPVVQHFPFGSLFSWDTDPEAAVPAQSVHMASHAPTNVKPPPAGSGSGTAAPWAQATQMPGSVGGVPSGPGIPYSRAPWTATGSSGPTVPRGGVPDTGPPAPTAFPRGQPGTASNQFAVPKAPWAKD